MRVAATGTGVALAGLATLSGLTSLTLGFYEPIDGGVRLAKAWDKCGDQAGTSKVPGEVAKRNTRLTNAAALNGSIPQANIQPSSSNSNLDSPMTWDGAPITGYRKMIAQAENTVCKEDSRLEAGLKGFGIGTVHGLCDSLVFGAASVALGAGAALSGAAATL